MRIRTSRFGTKLSAFLVVVTLQAAPKSAIQEHFQKLPLAFEENRGQADAAVRYVARSGSTRFGFAPDGARVEEASSQIRLRFPGGRAHAMEGRNRLVTLSHYYAGKDPSAWRVNIPNYGAIRYREVWP